MVVKVERVYQSRDPGATRALLGGTAEFPELLMEFNVYSTEREVEIMRGARESLNVVTFKKGGKGRGGGYSLVQGMGWGEGPMQSHCVLERTG